MPIEFTDLTIFVPAVGPAASFIRGVTVIVRVVKTAAAQETQKSKIFRETTQWVIDHIDEIAKGNVEGPFENPLNLFGFDKDGPAIIKVYPMWRRDP